MLGICASDLVPLPRSAQSRMISRADLRAARAIAQAVLRIQSIGSFPVIQNRARDADQSLETFIEEFSNASRATSNVAFSVLEPCAQVSYLDCRRLVARTLTSFPLSSFFSLLVNTLWNGFPNKSLLTLVLLTVPELLWQHLTPRGSRKTNVSTLDQFKGEYDRLLGDHVTPETICSCIEFLVEYFGSPPTLLSEQTHSHTSPHRHSMSPVPGGHRTSTHVLSAVPGPASAPTQITLVPTDEGLQAEHSESPPSDADIRTAREIIKMVEIPTGASSHDLRQAKRSSLRSLSEAEAADVRLANTGHSALGDVFRLHSPLHNVGFMFDCLDTLSPL